MDTPAPGTLAPFTPKSLSAQAGNGHPLLVPGVAVVSTATEPSSSKNSEDVVRILMAILYGITKETTSGDVLSLGVLRAQSLCQRLGISEDLFEEVVEHYGEFCDKARAWNPLAF